MEIGITEKRLSHRLRKLLRQYIIGVEALYLNQT